MEEKLLQMCLISRRLREHFTGSSHLNPDCSLHKLYYLLHKQYYFGLFTQQLLLDVFSGIDKCFRKGEIRIDRGHKWGREIKSDREKKNPVLQRNFRLLL